MTVIDINGVGVETMVLAVTMVVAALERLGYGYAPTLTPCEMVAVMMVLIGYRTQPRFQRIVALGTKLVWRAVGSQRRRPTQHY